MRHVPFQETWPESWRYSHPYDRLEIWGDLRHRGYAYAYAERRRHALELIRRAVAPPARVLDIAAAWETMIFVVVTAILVPATMRWHWWRFPARAFTLGVIGTAVEVTAIAVFTDWGNEVKLPVTIGISLLWCIALGLALPPTDREVLLRFYASVRPFGVWGPVRRDAAARGLVPVRDPQPWFDVLNGFLSMGLQVALCLVAFFALLGRTDSAIAAGLCVATLAVVMYFTWYRTLPRHDEATLG